MTAALKQFGGVEPLVGEIVGLRTFRVDESGMLLPLYSNLAWYDRKNTATCAPPTGEAERHDHDVPSADCECGFYAYGTTQAAATNRSARYVLAVVSCWGRIVAGTQGIRAEHARIDALWLHPNVPLWVRRRIATAYPSARIFTDRDAMLARFPLSTLSCYEPGTPRRIWPRVAATLAGAGLLGLGLLPASVLGASTTLWDLWLGTTLVVAALAAWLLLAAHGIGHVAAGMLATGVLAWLVAPLLGPPGWLLRLPVLRAIAVAAGGYLLALRPGYFPVVKAPRERSFCDVRP